MSLDKFLKPGDVVVRGIGDETGPDRCPSPICGRAYDKGTVNDVIGVFGLRTDILLCWKCPFCGHEWNDDTIAAVIRPHTLYRAIYQPVRTDDLRPECIPLIGQTLIFSTGWLITSEDGGSYTGNYAMMLEAPRKNVIGWVPSCDLKILEEVTWDDVSKLRRSK